MRTQQKLRALVILALVLILIACANSQGNSQNWLSTPVDGQVFVGSLGQRHGYGIPNPIAGEPRHTGNDYLCNVGDPVHAVVNGEVVLSGVWNIAPGYGNEVILRHDEPNGSVVYTQYAHGSKVLVTLGQKVKQDDTIMLCGNTGLADEAHVHFGVSNQPPEDFVSWYEHADEQPDGRGWLDPDAYLGKAMTPAASKLPSWVEMLPMSMLLLFCLLPFVLLIIAWQVRKDKVAEAVIWVADNGDMIKRALVIGLKDALGWWIFVIASVVVLSPQLMMIIRHGMKEWLAGSSTIENWRIAILAIALLVNLLVRAVVRASNERIGERNEPRRRTSWGRLAMLVVLIGVVGATGVYAIKKENTSVSSTTVQLYYPDFPEVTYWNGAKKTFYLSGEVQNAVRIATELHGCDPKLVVAVAFSESPQYNNTESSPSGAEGVWQFMPGTWETYWPGEHSLSPTNTIAAADAACRMTNDLRLAQQSSEESFVSRFTGEDGGQCWNCADTDGSDNDPAVKQAHFTWRLWKTLKSQKEVTIDVNPN